jgi:hypothetical protein
MFPHLILGELSFGIWPLDYLISEASKALFGAILFWFAARYFLKLKIPFSRFFSILFILYAIIDWIQYLPLYYLWKPQSLFSIIIILIIGLSIGFIIMVLYLKWRLNLDYKKSSILTLLGYSEWLIIAILFLGIIYLFRHLNGQPMIFHLNGHNYSI